MMIKSDEPATADKLASSKKSQRTDFLGALKESSSSATQENAKAEQKEEADLNTFDPDGQSNTLIRSTLADVSHNPVSFSNTSLSESKSSERDTLSRLFDEMADAQEVADNQQVQESK